VSRPALWIEFPLEGEPRAILDCLNEGEEVRLLDWLRSRREERMAVALACFDWYAETALPRKGAPREDPPRHSSAGAALRSELRRTDRRPLRRARLTIETSLR
jgi:hypothetical protein